MKKLGMSFQEYHQLKIIMCCSYLCLKFSAILIMLKGIL